MSPDIRPMMIFFALLLLFVNEADSVSGGQNRRQYGNPRLHRQQQQLPQSPQQQQWPTAAATGRNGTQTAQLLQSQPPIMQLIPGNSAGTGTHQLEHGQPAVRVFHRGRMAVDHFDGHQHRHWSRNWPDRAGNSLFHFPI